MTGNRRWYVGTETEEHLLSIQYLIIRTQKYNLIPNKGWCHDGTGQNLVRQVQIENWNWNPAMRTLFDQVMILARGILVPSEHQSNDRAVRYPLCALPMAKVWLLSDKFDQHFFSLYCGFAKPKFKTGPGYWFLWESYELHDLQN